MDIKRNPAGSVDLLHGPILRSLIIFMLPVFISNIFQQLYNVADTALVGNYLGENALAAVGSVSSIFEFLVFFSQSLGVGLSIVVGREFGKGDTDRLKRAVAGSIVVGAVVCFILTTLVILGMRPFLVLIKTPEEVLPDSYAYISVIGSFIIVMFIYNLCSGILRAIGNSVMPLLFLIFSSALNIVLDIVMLRVFHMGVVGTAIATVAAQGVSAVCCFIYIARRVQLIIPEKKHFRYDRALYAELASQGLAMASMGSIVNMGSIILQIGRQSHMFNFVTMVVMVICMQIFAKPLVALISGSDNETILRNGTAYLQFCTFFFAPLMEILILRNSLQSLGSKIIPMISSGIELAGKILFTLVFIPKFGYNAVIACEPLIWVVMAVQLLYAFYNDPYIKLSGKDKK